MVDTAAARKLAERAGSDMESAQGWKWYGYAGHFIASPLCCFHMSTRVGRHLISTIGDYRPRGPDGKQEPIGAGKDSLFETYVFECDGDDADSNPNVLSFTEVDGIRYATSLAAERGHYEFCRKYDTPDPLSEAVVALADEVDALREARDDLIEGLVKIEHTAMQEKKGSWLQAQIDTCRRIAHNHLTRAGVETLANDDPRRALLAGKGGDHE